MATEFCGVLFGTTVYSNNPFSYHPPSSRLAHETSFSHRESDLKWKILSSENSYSIALNNHAKTNTPNKKLIHRTHSSKSSSSFKDNDEPSSESRYGRYGGASNIPQDLLNLASMSNSIKDLASDSSTEITGDVPTFGSFHGQFQNHRYRHSFSQNTPPNQNFQSNQIRNLHNNSTSNSNASRMYTPRLYSHSQVSIFHSASGPTSNLRSGGTSSFKQTSASGPTSNLRSGGTSSFKQPSASSSSSLKASPSSSIFKTTSTLSSQPLSVASSSSFLKSQPYVPARNLSGMNGSTVFNVAESYHTYPTGYSSNDRLFPTGEVPTASGNRRRNRTVNCLAKDDSSNDSFNEKFNFPDMSRFQRPNSNPPPSPSPPKNSSFVSNQNRSQPFSNQNFDTNHTSSSFSSSVKSNSFDNSLSDSSINADSQSQELSPWVDFSANNNVEDWNKMDSNSNLNLNSNNENDFKSNASSPPLWSSNDENFPSSNPSSNPSSSSSPSPSFQSYSSSPSGNTPYPNQTRNTERNFEEASPLLSFSAEGYRTNRSESFQNFQNSNLESHSKPLDTDAFRREKDYPPSMKNDSFLSNSSDSFSQNASENARSYSSFSPPPPPPPSPPSSDFRFSRPSNSQNSSRSQKNASMDAFEHNNQYMKKSTDDNYRSQSPSSSTPSSSASFFPSQTDSENTPTRNFQAASNFNRSKSFESNRSSNSTPPSYPTSFSTPSSPSPSSPSSPSSPPPMDPEPLWSSSEMNMSLSLNDLIGKNENKKNESHSFSQSSHSSNTYPQYDSNNNMKPNANHAHANTKPYSNPPMSRSNHPNPAPSPSPPPPPPFDSFNLNSNSPSNDSNLYTFRGSSHNTESNQQSYPSSPSPSSPSSNMHLHSQGYSNNSMNSNQNASGRHAINTSAHSRSNNLPRQIENPADSSMDDFSSSPFNSPNNQNSHSNRNLYNTNSNSNPSPSPSLSPSAKVNDDVAKREPVWADESANIKQNLPFTLPSESDVINKSNNNYLNQNNANYDNQKARSLSSVGNNRKDKILAALEAWNRTLNPEARREKYAKMAENPFALFRGANHLFWGDFSGDWRLCRFGNHRTRTWLVGDMHAYNFGAFYNNRNEVVYGINDFDEAFIGDYQYDVWRMAISVVLLMRENGNLTGVKQERVVKSFAQSYLSTVISYRQGASEQNRIFTAQTTKGRLSKFLQTVEANESTEKMLDKWCIRGRNGKVSEFNYDLKDKLTRCSSTEKMSILDAFPEYWKNQRTGSRLSSDDVSGDWRLLSVAKRISAGVASLGRPRYYLLAETPEKVVLLDVKKQVKPTACHFMSTAEKWNHDRMFVNDADRHAKACFALTAHPDPYNGWMNLDDSPYSVHERSPFKKAYPALKSDLRGEYDRLTLDKERNMKDMADQWGMMLAMEHAHAGIGHESDGHDGQLRFRNEIDDLTRWNRDDFVDLVWQVARDYAMQVESDWRFFMTALAP